MKILACSLLPQLWSLYIACDSDHFILLHVSCTQTHLQMFRVSTPNSQHASSFDQYTFTSKRLAPSIVHDVPSPRRCFRDEPAHGHHFQPRCDNS